jgi:Tol biopolymer transport system component/C-terminal processing protease CtpA/Prc
MRKLYLVLLTFSFITTTALFAQNHPRWLRYPAISPDGQTILFNFQGDIYKVPAAGGDAVPLTLSEHHEYAAVWSHDGKQIAFASNRYGNFDVFVMPAKGGEAKRLSYHSNNEKPSDFTPDNRKFIFTALRQDLHTNAQFPTGSIAELYQVPAAGGRVEQLLTFPALDATFSPNGRFLIYHDKKGSENIWRKHHTSAVTRDIWSYNTVTKTHRQLTTWKGEDRNPIFDQNNDDYYYLSEESGTFNIHKSSRTAPEKNEQITSFKHHPVRFLTISDKATLCFSYHGDIYTMQGGQPPQKVAISMGFDGRQSLDKVIKVNKQFTEASLSPNEKEFAYVFRGEIFVSSINHGTTKRITNTAYQERSVSFSPDGRSLVYAAETEGSWNVYQHSLVRDEEKYFFLSTVLKREPIIVTKSEEFQPAFSPDGKEVAFLENRTTLKVINLASGDSRLVLPGEYNYSYSDGDMWYSWSPDSKWFLVNFGSKERIFFPEVGLIEASGKGELRNLTQSGFTDQYPKWAMRGEMMIWMSTRLSGKSENGWRNEGDVFGMFFKQAAFDRFNLSEEEFSLLKKEKKELDDEESGAREDQEEAEKPTEPLTFDWEDMTERKRKLTVHTSQASDYLLSKKGDKLYYLTRFEGKNDLWVSDLRTKETKLFAKIGADEVSMEMDKKGKFLFLLADGKPKKVDLKTAEVKAINTQGEIILKQNEERTYIFEHAWRQVKQKFYVEDLQGVDWDFYKKEYQPFLSHINNSYDFTEMLSEMLGELNASHTGSGYRHRPEGGDATASLGLLYDYAHGGSGLKVAEILKGGPLHKAASKLKAGDIIEQIDGQELSTDIDFYSLLNRKAGQNLLLSVYDPSAGTRWSEVVKPVSLREERQLLYERWVATRREETLRLSKGRLGYVHVRSMNDPSMREVIEEALGRHVSAEALIVDTRFNGGGNLHDPLSEFLTGEKYFEVIPHGQFIGHQPWGRWTKPSIVLMGEGNYSDAHLFPVAYKIKNGGQTLGMPVPGTGTFVWWETQIDPTIYFGIPMGGWKPLDGPFLENNQLEPDISVRNEPDVMAKGRDQQLEEAVKMLLKE